MDQRIVFIVPYFGKIPTGYFELFLRSCSINEAYADWVFISDSHLDNLPINVKVVKSVFYDFQSRVRSQFYSEAAFISPHKICDYKPLFGYLFPEIIEGYTFWGYCDIDVVFGSFSPIIERGLLKDYDRIFSLGHLCIYRNDLVINRLVLDHPLFPRICKEIFGNPATLSFDEWHGKGCFINVNEIFRESEYKFFEENWVYDISPELRYFSSVNYNIKEGLYRTENQKLIFEFTDNGLYSYYINGSKLESEKTLYIHLKERSLLLKRGTFSDTQIIVSPQGFFGGNESLNKELFIKYFKESLIDFLLRRAYRKYRNLRYRIKNIRGEKRA